MPKQMSCFKEGDSTNKNSRLLRSYFSFIDSNFSSDEFTYSDVTDWLNDTEDMTGKNVNFIVAMLVRAWIVSDFIVDNKDNTFTPIYFEDLNREFKFKDVDVDDDEELGKPDLDDEHLKNYGNRDMRFPKINDSFDEGKKLNKKKMLKEVKYSEIRVTEAATSAYEETEAYFAESGEWFSVKDFCNQYKGNENFKKAQNLLRSFVRDNLNESIQDSVFFGSLVYTIDEDEVYNRVENMLNGEVENERAEKKGDKYHYTFEYDANDYQGWYDPDNLDDSYYEIQK